MVGYTRDDMVGGIGEPASSCFVLEGTTSIFQDVSSSQFGE